MTKRTSPTPDHGQSTLLPAHGEFHRMHFQILHTCKFDTTELHYSSTISRLEHRLHVRDSCGPPPPPSINAIRTYHNTSTMRLNRKPACYIHLWLPINHPHVDPGQRRGAIITSEIFPGSAPPALQGLSRMCNRARAHIAFTNWRGRQYPGGEAAHSAH